MNLPIKPPSPVRVAVIAGAFAVLASAVTPAYAATPAAQERSAKQRVAQQPVPKKQPPPPPPATAPNHGNSGGGGNAGPFSLDWTVSAALRPL